MVNYSDMLQELLENLVNSSGLFMLVINKRTVKRDPAMFDLFDQEVFYADKDGAVARLFDLCELYGWQLTRVDASCERGSPFTVKYEVMLEKTEVMPYENNDRPIQQAH